MGTHEMSRTGEGGGREEGGLGAKGWDGGLPHADNRKSKFIIEFSKLIIEFFRPGKQPHKKGNQ